MKTPMIGALALLAAPAAAQLGVSLDQKLVASDYGADDLFGEALAREGTRLVVGAPHNVANCDSGTVYVFDQVAGGWSQVAELLPVAPSFTIGFGTDVAVQGDTVVGVSRTTNGRFRAHVWEAVNGVFGGTETVVLLANEGPTMITAPDPSVAMAGRFIVIGSPAASSLSGSNTGAVFVFEKLGASWTSNQLTKLSPSGLTQSFDWIGMSVDTTGQIIVAGSPAARDLASGQKTGKALVWELTASGWVRTGSLQSVDVEPGDRFAEALSLDGTTLAVGVPLEDGTGAVEIWQRNPDSTWSFCERVQPNVPQAASWFGASVDLSGNRLVVGAPREGSGGNRGAVYLFARGPAGFVQQERVVPADASQGMWFGTAVDASAGGLVAGAARDSSLAQRAGSTYVYDVISTEAATSCGSAAGSCLPAIAASPGPGGITLTGTGLPSASPAWLVAGVQGPVLPLSAGGLCVQPPLERWCVQPASSPGACGTTCSIAIEAAGQAPAAAPLVVQWVQWSGGRLWASDALELPAPARVSGSGAGAPSGGQGALPKRSASTNF